MQLYIAPLDMYVALGGVAVHVCVTICISSLFSPGLHRTSERAGSDPDPDGARGPGAAPAGGLGDGEDDAEADHGQGHPVHQEGGGEAEEERGGAGRGTCSPLNKRIYIIILE